MENKNLIIAFVLILGVWFGSNLLFPPKEPAPTPESGTATAERAAHDQSSAQVTSAETASGREFAAVQTLPPLAEAPEQREVVVENELFEAVFTSTGARLQSFILKKYRQTPDADSAPVTLVEVENRELATLRTLGQGDFDLSSETPFAVSVEEDRLTLAAGEERQLVFSALTPRGMFVEKIYTFRGDGYDFDLQIRVTNRSSQTLRGTVALALVQPWDDAMDESRYSFVGPALFQDDKVHTFKVEDVEEEAVERGSDAVWSAFERKYFMSAVVPMEDAGERFRIEKSGETVENSIQTASRALQSGEQARFDYLLYFGPRDLEILRNVDHQLEEAIDFGFFGVIARPLLVVLKFFYQYVGNYGVAIILLTVIIKLLFWPLTQKSYQSMKSMQTLQPEMQKIREKFKNDKERMNKEIMELYKTKRVNPMGGCLPMFVQIPVFFALYKVLLGTIELRHAPFVFWIQDLAAKDPYYITPIIMGGTMFLQQKMSPTTMDPAQAKIFMFMPIIFTFMFLNFPSGLVIYWLVNNLLTIFQQWFINREGKPAAA